MTVHELDSAGDELLEVYRDLRNRPVAGGARFILEGEHILERLIASELELESVLVSSRKWDSVRHLVPGEVQAYVLSDQEIEKLVGFKFHRGVLGCGIRPPLPGFNSFECPAGEPLRIIACPEISDAENLGSIIRTARCLGASALVLGERSTDAYSRRCIRVSMGTVFTLPVYKAKDIAADLLGLASSREVQFVAAVADGGAQPLLSVTPARDWCVLLGNEEKGLGAELVELCEARVCIPMARGADSLNVSVAAGIILHHMSAAQHSSLRPR
ncbi:MAG: RNA methyltransferase [Planctomycetota bacterium]|nr:RNA methyltransferase [Planctomycetota bacterium]